MLKVIPLPCGWHF